MKQYTTTTITTYEAKSDYYKNFLFDIVVSDDEYGAWLYHKSMSIKTYVCGVLRSYKDNLEDFLETVEANTNDYIADYIEEYCD